eukprot:gb/GFBE01041653.1/.p1 GENE.gb/GFBE01041653.1/~~gb/GFBE01041653.1/.p1  ORF type:complete len:484 (+),score=104.80 gb/GFBE01041653.1/:1-1452(+)
MPRRGAAVALTVLCGQFHAALSLKTNSDAVSCSLLRNEQSYSSLQVGVGTPAQKFSLIADTGSSYVIVTSCECQKSACYGYSSPCFEGSNASSTFHVPVDKDGNAPAVSLTFGSGSVYGVMGTDIVSVGPVAATMEDSLIVMYEHELDAGITNFEGIFGLGIPYNHVAEEGIKGDHWVKKAGVDRFSMCFENSQEDGVFKLNTPVQSNPMGSIGKLHWGLDFRGISLGSETAEVIFCSRADKTAEMKTACGFIPDSGTTLMMGPSRHITELYASLCDRWPRCQKEYKKIEQDGGSEPSGLKDLINEALDRWGLPKEENPFHVDPAVQAKQDKKTAFETVIADCQTWGGTPAKMEAELPPIFWHVAGAEGNTQTLAMQASDYIVAMKFGAKIVCRPFFGSYEYETRYNGPAWIVGTALFYEYEVHFDISATPPSVSFTAGSCGSCGLDGKVAASSLGMIRKRNDALRRQDFKVRMPRIDKDSKF